MKTIFITATLFLSATVFAQETVTSIQNKHTELIINDSIALKKGNPISIYLPAGKDFFFVKQKKATFNTKLLGKMADVVGTGAGVVGMGSGNMKTVLGAVKVAQKARAVSYGADAIEKIQDLPISNDAKKIAGKSMTILEWNMTDDGYVVLAELEKKKYEIFLQEAIVAGEVKL